MGLLQAAYRTYENYAEFAGKIEKEKEKEPLVPVSHIVQNAGIEIELSNKGEFLRAALVNKEDAKTIIPATIKSANRVGDNTHAHPLCDQIRYVAPFGGEKFKAYLEQLEKWESSEFSHPKLSAILAYIIKGTIVDDLSKSEVIKLNDGKPADEKLLVRWLVHRAPENSKTACWEDKTLFDAFTSYYGQILEDADKDICLVSGNEDIICETHPKGVVGFSYGAKLISANDSSGYTYRGRFETPRQAYNVGYFSSQKAHNALRWVVSNHGFAIGGRTFVCWNTKNKRLPSIPVYSDINEVKGDDFTSYKKQLAVTLGGYKDKLGDTDNVIISALEAATTGRLSVTYYTEMKASDFLERLEHWYTTCCWDRTVYGVQSPPIIQIIHCAFGTLRNDRLETDDKIMREYMQILLHCIVSKRGIPENIVKAAVVKAGNLKIYPISTRELILATVCAVVRKYRNDKLNKEEWGLALNTQNNDRSYLFGRLLAVAEKVERSTYEGESGRETNAIRMQTIFTQRPMYAWRILEEKLNPYFSKLPYGLASYYKNTIGEITEKMSVGGTGDLGRRLEDTYLLGYYHQRSELNKKKNKENDGGKNNESAE